MHGPNKYIRIAFFTYLFLARCTEEQIEIDDTTDKYDIHLVSNSSQNEIAYWKNGVQTSLGRGSILFFGFGGSVSDVWLLLWNYDDRSVSYWKNGSLQSTTKFDNGTYVERAFVSGNDIYLFGYLNATPVCWKNEIELPGYYSKGATAVTVSGSDVYVIGYSSSDSINHFPNNEYWLMKNGMKKSFCQDCRLGSVSISGNDVYIGGDYLYSSKIGYWKNGSRISITNGTNLAYSAQLFISGIDVYLFGKEDSKQKYWKNNLPPVLLSHDQRDYVSSVFIVDNVIFEAGGSYLSETMNACYWVNFRRICLTGGGNDAYLTSILIVKKQ